MVNLRDENVLRELNLYPLWVRRNIPTPVAGEINSVAAEADHFAAAQCAELIPPVSQDQRISLSGVDVASLGWPELGQKVHECVSCKLRAGCAQPILGSGDEKAEWLIIGEDPGVDENASGKLLENMLAAIQLKRGNKVYQTSVVKCTPTEQHTLGADEIGQCLPYLHRQISLIQPKLIIVLGKIAASALLGKEGTLASLRGSVHDYQGIPVIITYHPAYLLRMPAEKAHAWQDLCLAVATMKLSKEKNEQ